MTTIIALRNATPEDQALLKYWDSQPHTVASAPNDFSNWEEDLAYQPDWREQLIAELNGRPIGFVQIIDPALEESHYWGDVPQNLRAIDIWMGEASDIGKGYGTVMMQLALERCFLPDNVTAVIIDPLDSNTKARRFYERIGFKFVEHRQFDEDYCAVYQLTRGDWITTQLQP
jgi:aminoglycoside 6'-N-acetyltransferase